MSCSSVRIRTTPYATFAEFDDGFRLVMHEGSCYEPDACTFDRLKRAFGTEGAVRTIRDSAALPIIMVLAIILSIALFFFRSSGASHDERLPIVIAILIVNVAIHELGHAIALKLYFPWSKVRIGFRFMCIFPTFYVNASDSYMLPRGKKISVHLAGVCSNALYLIAVALFVPSLLGPSSIVVGTSLLNLLPIMRGDGYHVLMALLGKRRPCVGRKREALEDCARSVVMLIVIYLAAGLAPEYFDCYAAATISLVPF